MRAFLASPLGFLIGLSLGALGGGGSILAVPALVFAAGQDPKGATATSLLLVGAAAAVGVAPHWRAGRVRLGMGITFGLVGIGGSLVGSQINRSIDPDLLLLAFSGLTLLAAWRMVTGCPTCTQVGQNRAITAGDSQSRWAGIDARTVVLVAVTGTGVGFLTGLFGVGGGFVIVPALALALKLPMPQAIGTSLVVIAVNSAVGLASRLATTSIDWHITIPFAIAAIGGVVTGERIAGKLDPKKSLHAFALLLTAVALYTAVRSGIALQ